MMEDKKPDVEHSIQQGQAYTLSDSVDDKKASTEALDADLGKMKHSST